jgi:uncharacterized protein YegL
VPERSTEGQIVMPFYIVCDVSGSMCADMPLLNAGIEALREEIMKDPVADDLAMLSVIAFSDTARTVAPLDFPTALEMSPMTCGGLTNFSAAFQEVHRAFEADRVRLKAEGKKVYRPCVFFMTDGMPTSKDHRQTLRGLFGYDPVTKQGNPRYPYITAFGFGSATAESLRDVAYPDFGEKRGRYFLAREDVSFAELFRAMAGMIATSVLGSTLSATMGAPQFVPPPVDAAEELEGSFV